MDSSPKFKLGDVVFAPEFELKDEVNWDTDFPNVAELLSDCAFESGTISEIRQTVDDVRYIIDGVGIRSEPYVAKTKIEAIVQSLDALLDYCVDKSDEYKAMADQAVTELRMYQKWAAE